MTDTGEKYKIYFDQNESKHTESDGKSAENSKAINDFITKLLDDKYGTFDIIAHADGVGKDDYNQTLSEDRAQDVKTSIQTALEARYEADPSLAKYQPIEDVMGRLIWL